MTPRTLTLTFWLCATLTLGAILAVVYRIATTPGAPYPVTSAVLAAILLLGLLWLGCKEFIEREDHNYQRRVQRDMARNLEDQ